MSHRRCFRVELEEEIEGVRGWRGGEGERGGGGEEELYRDGEIVKMLTCANQYVSPRSPFTIDLRLTSPW